MLGGSNFWRKKISNAIDETRTIFINLINQRSADYLGDTNKELNLKRRRETVIDEEFWTTFLWNAKTGTLEVTS